MQKQQEASLGVLLVRLHWSTAAAKDETKKKDMPTFDESYETLINNTAQKLKDHMEQVNKGGGKHHILHHANQYAHILREVFPEADSDSKRQQAQGQEHDTKRATTGEAKLEDKDQIGKLNETS
ncbi:hypothetical protein BS78_K071900 [Paspalum vaginatum]|uniref:Uncharacterized protein n=1 Tax=Paspalum vaginatum TaxID=158149 RepID=A0A9W7X9A8_9POAL|nr:hypothetical protein BS78_K071900 [Paspalum vaginatum]